MGSNSQKEDPLPQRYESTIIAVPTLSDEDAGKLVTAYEELIASNGGTVLRTDRWGKRRLAYRVKKQEDGIYTLFFYEGPADLVRELERRARIDDRVIRFMTVHVDWEAKVARAEEARALRERNRPARPVPPGLPDDEGGYSDEEIPLA